MLVCVHACVHVCVSLLCLLSNSLICLSWIAAFTISSWCSSFNLSIVCFSLVFCCRESAVCEEHDDRNIIIRIILACIFTMHAQYAWMQLDVLFKILTKLKIFHLYGVELTGNLLSTCHSLLFTIITVHSSSIIMHNYSDTCTCICIIVFIILYIIILVWTMLTQCFDNWNVLWL